MHAFPSGKDREPAVSPTEVGGWQIGGESLCRWKDIRGSEGHGFVPHIRGFGVREGWHGFFDQWLFFLNV